MPGVHQQTPLLEVVATEPRVSLGQAVLLVAAFVALAFSVSSQTTLSMLRAAPVPQLGRCPLLLSGRHPLLEVLPRLSGWRAFLAPLPWLTALSSECGIRALHSNVTLPLKKSLGTV